MGENAFLSGNVACAEAAIRAGCRFFAGYPITPQSDIPEYMSERMPQVGGVFMQGESELASVNMVYGVACTGVRSMTSTSSPGFALMSETIAWFAQKVPAVFVDVSRGGPAGGTITASQQDYMTATKAPTIGGVRMFVLAPESAQELVDMTVEAFDIADKYRKPVLIFSDAIVNNSVENVVLPDMVDLKDLPDKSSWSMAVREEGEEPRTFSLSEGAEIMEGICKEFAATYDLWKETEQRWEEYKTEDAEYLITAFGSVGRICKAVVNQLRSEGIKIGLIRPQVLFPFPVNAYENIDYGKVKKIFTVELAIPPQFVEDVDAVVRKRAEMVSLAHSGGVVFDPDSIAAEIKKNM